MDILSLIGQKSELICEDIACNGSKLQNFLAESRFLVISESGSIDQLVTREIFKRKPKVLFNSDTTGEKDFEEFFADNEDLDMEGFETVGVIKNQPDIDEAKLDDFMDGIEALRHKGPRPKDEIVQLNIELLPEFAHKETDKYLDQRI